MKTAVEQLVDALRLWSNAWNEFDRTGKNKPQPIEEVIAPFIQMEKEQMIDFACDVYDLNYCKDKSFRNAAEQCYNETFKQEEQ
jgi:hypothetical protein